MSDNKLAFKGTPGEWSVKEFILDNCIGIIAEQGAYNNFDRIVVHTVGKSDSDKKERNVANAHLISAAPEAVEFIADLLEQNAYMLDEVQLERAEQILRKAYNF